MIILIREMFDSDFGWATHFTYSPTTFWLLRSKL